MDDMEKYQRILEGRCPECGKEPKWHSITCGIVDEMNLLKKLSRSIVSRKLIDTVKAINLIKQENTPDV